MNDRGDAPGRLSRGCAPRPPTALAYPEVVIRTRNPVRRLFHVCVAGAGWTVFAISWVFIFARRIGHDALITFLLLGLAFIGVVAVNLLWVGFNIGVYRMKGPRTHVRHVPFRVRRDAVGHVLQLPMSEELQTAGYVRVSISADGRTKHFEPLLPGLPGTARRSGEA